MNFNDFADKIIIGIDQTTDIDKLLDYGIKQFYFGYIDKEYLQKYALQTSLNRRYRQKEQFTSLDNVFETIDKIHANGGTIDLALNAFTSNAIMREYLLKLFEQFKERVDGIIVANITTASLLKRQNYKNIIISNLFGIYSTGTVQFIIDSFHPKKIILPRDISLKDIKSIVTTFKDMKFECFLYGDNCRFSESFCFSEHGYDSIKFGSLCSYALTNSLLVKAANPAFKHIVKNGKLSDKEKKELLRKKSIDIESLLDNLEINMYENNLKEVTEILEILSLFDKEMFYKSKKLYVRALNVLKNLDFAKAKELYDALKRKPFKEEDSYKIFHKLNSNAIYKTLKFFSEFQNITSYKIPSRGRDLYQYLIKNSNEPYNYKESQYNHETLY